MMIARLWPVLAVAIRGSGAWVEQGRAPRLARGIALTSPRTLSAETGAGVDRRHPRDQHLWPFVVERASSSAPLFMAVRNRGLEVRRETATPTEGDMTLYCKAGPDGKSVGDCPYAHYVRMVLEEKSLEYEVKPSTQDTKPQWLIEHYQGKMPALRHRKECYVESSVIADYLDFFFPNPPLKLTSSKDVEAAEAATAGVFPALAKYLKHTPDGDDDDGELRAGLEQALDVLESHLSRDSRSGPFLVGTGDQLSLLDCSLAPKLYHMKCGLEAFKGNAIDVATKFPAVQAYMDVMFGRDSFVKSSYPSETVAWGWSNARGAGR